MKTTIKNIAAIAASAALAAGMLAGCAGTAKTEEPPASVQESTEQFGPWVPEGVTLQASATPEEAVDGDAVVEVLDEAGNTVQMTAAEAKASGKQVVSGGTSAPAASNQGGSAPAASAPSAPSAPSHQHSWVPITSQKYVVDVPASEYLQCSCGLTFKNQSAWSAHSKEAGRGSSHAYRTVGNGEAGHYETITTGYSCSCGATK